MVLLSGKTGHLASRGKHFHLAPSQTILHAARALYNVLLRIPKSGKAWSAA